jgi:putative restriction endonuclease
MPDDSLRAACFASLDVLLATYGEDVPYRGGLDRSFAFRNDRVPFLAPAKGIFRAAAQEGNAALSINTSAKSPYDDEETPEGIYYAYRAGAIDQADNRALRAAYAQTAPLVYFIATRPRWYKPLYPVYVIADEPLARRVLVAPGRMVGPLDEREPVLVEDQLERRYAVRETASGFTRPDSGAASWSRTRAVALSVG